jgi:hypothetical protein
MQVAFSVLFHPRRFSLSNRLDRPCYSLCDSSRSSMLSTVWLVQMCSRFTVLRVVAKVWLQAGSDQSVCTRHERLCIFVLK